MAQRTPGALSFPPRLLLGLLLVGIAWPANWLLPGMRTHLLFFPLWLGYVLVACGWREAIRGDSIASRRRGALLRLFLLSVPLWWLFEALNLRLQNWEYLGRRSFGDLEYALLSSLSFSTVVPAVLATAELVRCAPWIERLGRGPAVPPTRALLLGSAALGALSLAAMLVWPRYLYPFAWVSGVLLLEPLCHRLGRRSLLSDLSRGDWRPWIALWAGGLVCGFFWEMWNSLSYPKWIYDTPGVSEPRLFEMPLLGYLGYLPFSMEVFLAKELVLPRDPQLAL